MSRTKVNKKKKTVELQLQPGSLLPSVVRTCAEISYKLRCELAPKLEATNHRAGGEERAGGGGDLRPIGHKLGHEIHQKVAQGIQSKFPFNEGKINQKEQEKKRVKNNKMKAKQEK